MGEVVVVVVGAVVVGVVVVGVRTDVVVDGIVVGVVAVPVTEPVVVEPVGEVTGLSRLVDPVPLLLPGPVVVVPRRPPSTPDSRSSTGPTRGLRTGSRNVPVGGTSMTFAGGGDVPPPPP